MKRDATTAYNPIHASQHGVTVSIDIVGELVSQAQIRNTLFFIASSIYDFANNIINLGKTYAKDIPLKK
jgi:hypothetical protein